jgi:hypothetical protein
VAWFATAPLAGGLLLAVRTLDKTQWAPFFDAASNSAVGKRAEIEVALLALGSQIEAEWAPLQGIIDDAQSDIIKIVLGDQLDHLIHTPQEVYVDDNPVGLSSVLITDSDGTEHIIKLRDPLVLPSA